MALIDQMLVTLYKIPRWDQLTEENKTSTIQDEGLYGMPVKIMEKQGEWAKIQTYYHYEGYVRLEALHVLSDEELSDWKNVQSQLYIVVQNFADVVAYPKVQGIRLQTLTRGAFIRVIEKAESPGGWMKVLLNKGQVGYIKEKYVEPYTHTPAKLSEAVLRKRIVCSALSYLGTPYRWGGKSPVGIDCSGLTSMAYLLNGLIIFRDAKIQEGFSVHPIRYADKKPGDLFYYPGHIAMYIGDEEYVHATGHDGSDGVVINSLNPDAPHYRADLSQQMYAVGSVF